MQTKLKEIVTLTIVVLLFTNVFSKKLPNIIIINADDIGYGDVGCYGATKVQTPNIDRLAKEGRRFIDAHSASSVCTPSRFALITGVYPHRKKMSGPVNHTSGLIIPTETATVASVMKKAGYATACIGKWHLGFGENQPDWNGELKPGPNELGFDYYYGVPIVNSLPPFVYVENHHVVGLVPEDPFVLGQMPVTRSFPEKGVSKAIGGAIAAHKRYDDEQVGTTLAGKALDWIKAKKDNPFFLYFATTNIHHPFTPAPRFKGTSQAGIYGDFIHELDWIVGQVLNTLEEQGLTDNTLIFFTSDNGGMVNLGGQAAVKLGHKMNGGLLGFKFDAWEGGHRVPFIAKWPGKIKANTVSKQLVSNVDFLATFLELTSQDDAVLANKNSISFLPALLKNPTQPIREELVVSPAGGNHMAVRKGKWLYIGAKGNGGFTNNVAGKHLFGGPAAVHFIGHHNSDMKDGEYLDDAPTAQLYDMEKDMYQTQNVVRQYPKVAEEMSLLLAKYKSQRGKGIL